MATRETFFAYLNIDHPMVAWEVAIGRLQSVTEITGERFGVSLWAYSLLQSYVQNHQPKRFENELRLEYIRQRGYRDCVSRLHGLYFFRSEEDARVALDRWGIPHLKRYISAVQFDASALTEVDSEWITFNLGWNADPRWMHAYWSRKPAGAKPLIEILALGSGVVLNKALRIEAYKRIYDRWPTSTPLLAAACCAFARCRLANVALVKPGLISATDSIHGNYYIDMKEFDENQDTIVAAVEDCKRTGECPPVVMPSDQTKIFTLPDFGPYSFELRDRDSSALFGSVHKAT
ncbi:MAG: hypothetical protein AB1555_08025 [Nitrospirota bacterium]